MSTAVPLSIPLHFASSSSSSSLGPTTPNDWKQKWHRTDNLRPRKERSLAETSCDYDDDWPDQDLDRWVTCMTSWEEPCMEESERPGFFRSSTLKISVADENGQDVKVNPSSTQGSKSTIQTDIGVLKGTCRIALGMQNGTIWVFRKRRSKPPLQLSPSIETTSRARSPSRNSIASDIGKSPTLTRTTSYSPRHEVDSIGSPTQPVYGMSDVNASGSATLNSSTIDAEEILETQWHAGRENHSVVGGMMEVLGLNHSNQHLPHSHPHSHTNSENHSGSSTPPSLPTKRKPRPVRKDSRSSVTSIAASISSPSFVGRPRTASSATTTTTDHWERDSTGEVEMGHRNRLSNLMGSSMQRKSSRAGQEAKTDGEGGAAAAVGKVEAEEEKSKMIEVEETVTLQCPSSSPVVSLIKIADDQVVSLQEDGSYIVWSLQDMTQLKSIDVKTAKIDLADDLNVVSGGSAAGSPASLSISTFPGLPSTTNSPAPRSRANSNATQPSKAVLDTLFIPGFSRLQLMKMIEGQSDQGQHPLVLCFDSVKRTTFVVEAGNAKVLALHVLPDSSSLTPIARYIGEGDCIEVLYINSKNNIQAQTVRIAPVKVVPSPLVHSKYSHLNSASAFLRREGLSNANSRAPSIAEEKSDVLDLGNGGLQDALEGLESLGPGVLLVWTRRGVHLLRRVAESLILADTILVESPFTVAVDEKCLAVNTETDTAVYRAEKGSSFKQISRFPLPADHHLQAASLSAGCIYRCFVGSDNKLRLDCSGRTIWQGVGLDVSKPVITASLPFSMERVVISLSSGHLVMCSLAELVSGKIPEPATTSQRHKGHVTMLKLVVNPRTQARHIVGGTEEGDVLFWDATTLKKQSERSLLTCPVVGMLVLGKDDNTLRLNGCLACVGADGSLVTFLLDGLNDLYTIPGRGVSIEELAVRADELLLIYEDARARVWDMRSLELRRSIGLDQATVLLDDGKGWWTRFSISALKLKSEHGSSGVLSSVPTSRDVAAGTMLANLRRAIEAASRMAASELGVSTADQTRQEDADDAVDEEPALGEKSQIKNGPTLSISTNNGRKVMQTLRSLIRCLMPLGLDGDCDRCAAKILNNKDLQATSWILSGTLSPTGHLALAAHTKSSSELLSLSPVVTTTRLLGLRAMLMVTSKITELQTSSLELLSLLDTIPILIGDSFQPPCLSLLTNYFTDSTIEIQQAAQTLFTTTLDIMSQEDIDALCDRWSVYLPSRVGQTGEQASKAVLLLGLVAIEKYLMLPPVLLKDIANSIALFLRDEALPANQTTAILLCDRGFIIFQHYFDAMDVVRALFSLSTSKNQDKNQEVKEEASITAVENRGLARRATLRIAEDNTPLFMTTLSLDILHAQSPAHCDATMRLVALMVRKRPLILYPNLPRLAEAVVKSLDPTVTSMRSVIHRSATIIISELVATYPTIAFHKELQRLAVGTFEGAIIMYDLKTSTRLYVIEAHHASLSGLSFSQDGRRLISICLKDNKVKVWKTGVGFGSFLSFGGAPRQGNLLSGTSNGTAAPTNSTSLVSSAFVKVDSQHSVASNGGTSAYKTFEFGRIDEDDPAKEANNLGLINFDWVGPRSIRVGVGETCIAFDAR